MAGNAQEMTGTTTAAVPEGFSVITEGGASILRQATESFYNPVQVFNRDTSIAVLRRFLQVLHEEQTEKQRSKTSKRGVRKAGHKGHCTVFEAMAASGLRSIRYAKEVEGLTKVIAQELDPDVIPSIKRNIEFNGVQDRIIVQQGDCRLAMLGNEGAYDVVDLDPYGSPCHLLDSAVQSLTDGGLLMVTATDMAVLCGTNGEACWAKYGSYPIHRGYCHEQGLRILLACIEAHANRVFVRVYVSPNDVKDSSTKQSYLYQSQGCDSFVLQKIGRKVMRGNTMRRAPGHGPVVPQQCPETGAAYLVGGPLWSEPIHDMTWAQAIRDDVIARADRYPAHAKVRSLMTTVLEELPDVPLYFSLHDVCRTLHCSAPKAEIFRSALINAGYRASAAHCNPLGVKTDAPWSVVWDVMRCWVAEHPVKNIKPDSYAAKLLAKEPTLKADFSRVRGAISEAKKSKQARFLPNPEPNWGPKARHKKIQDPPKKGAATTIEEEDVASNGAS